MRFFGATCTNATSYMIGREDKKKTNNRIMLPTLKNNAESSENRAPLDQDDLDLLSKPKEMWEMPLLCEGGGT